MGDIAHASQQKRRFLNSNATQRLLAFASLIGLIVFYSLASPNFFKFENLVAILIATAVTGILAVAVTFIIITGPITNAASKCSPFRIRSWRTVETKPLVPAVPSSVATCI